MDPEQGQRVADKIARDPFARSLGIELLELEPGHSRLAMSLAPTMLNFHGLPHGGAIFALADAAFAAASNAHGTQAVALQMTISYLAAAPPETRLCAEAVEVHLGRRTALYRVEVSDETGRLIAACQGVVYRKRAPL